MAVRKRGKAKSPAQADFLTTAGKTASTAPSNGHLPKNFPAPAEGKQAGKSCAGGPHKTPRGPQTAHDNYCDFYDLAPAGYFTVGADGAIRDVNFTAAKMVGMKKSALLKKKFSRLVAPADRGGYELSSKRLFETAAPQTCEARLKRADGGALWVRCQSIPVKGPGAAITQVRIIAMDIADLKLEQKRNRRFQKLLLDFQEKERARVAAELHDSLAQNMLVIANELKLTQRYLPAGHPLAEKLAASSALALRTMDEILEIAHGLRPSHLDQLGLEKAVHSLADRLVGSLELNIHVDIKLGGRRLSPEIEINVFRIIQEALNNIIKHSGARNAFIDLGVSGDALLLTITDDGRGFNVEKSLGAGLGLLGMMERARSLNGVCTVKSGGQDQTVFSCMIPLPPAGGAGPP